jgi:protein-S-isoprenylcysteine O-methyltransferase Ste14
MRILYKYRGFISAALAVLLLLSPPAANFEMLALPLFAFSVSLRVWARMHIGLHSREAELCAPQIVESGPYSFFKHPLYLSNWMAGVSFAILHSGFSKICAIFCLAYLLFLLLLALRESSFLKEMQPAPQICIFKPQIKYFFKSISGDKWTWFWQFSIILLIWKMKTL